ncbi:phage terminase small subunit [Pontibacter ummariensis]|uniref:Phage terminase small subunit n=1 Tax=Pontibacter ummariensis TaxID=1610492 RepID=A0A239IY10_9BACT|nr:terminase small subunit [Pontibacter ummariensis]PRY09028.1 phage terminase small subunit [Pontibacter ummariensis]SNS98666.1 phage terminase small subunit [Pontibacter ummariensis]
MAKYQLTQKQQRFCLEYLKDSNAKAAAVRAGYSEKTAMEQGYQLLQKTSVQKEISRLQAIVAEETNVQVKDLVKELAKVAFTNLPDLLETGTTLKVKNLGNLTEAQRASILEIKETRGKDGSVTRTIKTHSKLTAIDMLMKNLGGYVTASDLIDRLPEERLAQLVDEIMEKLKR